MVKKIVYYFVILAAVAISISAVVIIKGQRKGNVSQPQAASGLDVWDCISATTVNAYRMNNVRLQPVVLTAYTDQRVLPLSEVIGKRSVIVLQYSDLNCDICVDSALSYLTAFLKRAATSNVVIIASTDNRRLLSFFVRINHIDPKIVYYIGNSDLARLYGTVVPNVPFVYFTDSSLTVSDAFFPVKELPRLSEIYYAEMLTKRFTKKDDH